MDAIKAIIEHFDDFLKRSILPSSSFIMFLLIYDIFKNNCEGLTYLNQIDSTILVITMLIAFVGLSSMLTIIHQAIFDNYLKGDFEGKYIFKNENKEFIELRNKVINSLNDGVYTDNKLYQILVSKLKKSDKEVDTGRYVDDAKNIGIFCISFLFITIVYLFSLTFWIGYIVLLSLAIAGIFIYIGRELIKAKYRSRATRLYINYLDLE